MNSKKRKVWVSLYRYSDNEGFLVKTRSDCIRAWWITKQDYTDIDTGKKTFEIVYVLHDIKNYYYHYNNGLCKLGDAIWHDKKLYKSAWLSLLLVLGVSKKQVLDDLKDRLSVAKIKVKEKDMWGHEREREKEVVDGFLAKRIKFILE